MLKIQLQYYKSNSYLITILFVLVLCPFTFAADPTPGSACSVSNAYMRSGGPENSGVVYDMTCQGGVWVITKTYSASASVGIGTSSPSSGSILDIYGTGSSQSAMMLPRDTTANRPTGVEGMIRYNSTTKAAEVYQGATPGWGSIPSLVAKVDLTGQTAAIAATTMFTPTVDGMYMICGYANITTAGTSGTLNVVSQYESESGDTAKQTQIVESTTSITAVHNVTTGCVSIYLKSTTTLKYNTTLSGAAGSLQYTLHIQVLQLE